MATPMAQPDPTRVMGRRVVAALIDGFLVIVPALLLISASFEYLDVDDLGMDPDRFCDVFLAENDGICVNFEDVDGRVYFDESTNLSGTGVYWVSNFLFLVVLQGFTGWTPGKLVLGIRVIGEDGSRPGFVKALLRWLLWIVDGFPYIIPGLTGLIAAVSTAGHRRVGDVVAKTFVVHRRAVGTPLMIEDGGRLIIGDEAATAAAPLGWGAPPPPAAAPPPSAPPVAQPTPGVDGPQWDEARGTYIQWDPAQGAWMQWDEGFKAWIRIPGQ